MISTTTSIFPLIRDEDELIISLLEKDPNTLLTLSGVNKYAYIRLSNDYFRELFKKTHPQFSNVYNKVPLNDEIRAFSILQYCHPDSCWKVACSALFNGKLIVNQQFLKCIHPRLFMLLQTRIEQTRIKIKEIEGPCEDNPYSPLSKAKRKYEMFSSELSMIILKEDGLENLTDFEIAIYDQSEIDLTHRVEKYKKRYYGLLNALKLYCHQLEILKEVNVLLNPNNQFCNFDAYKLVLIDEFVIETKAARATEAISSVFNLYKIVDDLVNQQNKPAKDELNALLNDAIDTLPEREAHLIWKKIKDETFGSQTAAEKNLFRFLDVLHNHLVDRYKTLKKRILAARGKGDILLMPDRLIAAYRKLYGKVNPFEVKIFNIDF